MLALVSVESLVPPGHPLRELKPLVDGVLRRLSDDFDAMYAEGGRPSIPPERLLKAEVLIALYSIRSETLFCEQLGYNLLYRWFLDMDLQDTPFDRSTFSKNRQRLLKADIARRFFDEAVGLAREGGFLSSEHFSVDGSMIEAWASIKSFRSKDDDGDNNSFPDFRGQKRSNETHESKTDPEARLKRKGNGQGAKLCYEAHILIENRNGLVTDYELTQASGTAERDAAGEMVSRLPKRRRRATIAADKAYDTKDFVRKCRKHRATPHVAQNQHARRRSAIDGRTTRHRGYGVSTSKRLLVEKVFGWMKTTAGFRRTRFRGRQKTAAAGAMVVATYNLLRIKNLQAAPA